MKKDVINRNMSAEGYFTVEAAMVLPVVCVVILLIVYLWFFQYNRCLMEQDAGVLALRGAVMQADDNEERIVNLRNQADAINKEKYIAWECGTTELKIGNGVLSVEQSGKCWIPFGIIGSGEREALSKVSFKNHLLSPVSFVRNYRKIIGGE